MQRFAGIFFEVKACDANALGAAVVFDFDPATGSERELKLGDLVALRKIGIEIVFAGEAGAFVDGTVEGQGGAHAQFDSAFVEDRKSAGESETDGASVGIGRVAEARGATAKDFGMGEELRVDFQADDDLVFGEEFGREGGFGDEFGHGSKEKYIRGDGEAKPTGASQLRRGEALVRRAGVRR